MNWVGLLKIKNIIGNVKSTFKSHKWIWTQTEIWFLG
jgi:hypothetical protein